MGKGSGKGKQMMIPWGPWVPPMAGCMPSPWQWLGAGEGMPDPFGPMIDDSQQQQWGQEAGFQLLPPTL